MMLVVIMIKVSNLLILCRSWQSREQTKERHRGNLATGACHQIANTSYFSFLPLFICVLLLGQVGYLDSRLQSWKRKQRKTSKVIFWHLLQPCLCLIVSVALSFSHFKIEAANYLHCRALAEKQAAMVMAAAEAKRRMVMETSTNGAMRGGCCARCWGWGGESMRPPPMGTWLGDALLGADHFFGNIREIS